MKTAAGEPRSAAGTQPVASDRDGIEDRELHPHFETTSQTLELLGHRIIDTTLLRSVALLQHKHSWFGASEASYGVTAN